MITDIEKTIREYLPDIIHMSLATCAGEQPWVCEVHYAYDTELNLYFRSRDYSRHGQEIALNPKVAGNMVVQHGLTDKPRGVYFQGTAELMENVTAETNAYNLYCERFNTDESILEDANVDGGHRFYKITVNHYYVFDSRESSPSTKYELPWN